MKNISVHPQSGEGLFMDHPFQDLFEGLETVIQAEADGFAQVLTKMVSFDVVSECSSAMGIFTAAG